VLVASQPPSAAEAPLITFQQAIARALQQQQQQQHQQQQQQFASVKPRSVSVSMGAPLPPPQFAAAGGVGGGGIGGSSGGGGGVAALMMQGQKVREGETRAHDCTRDCLHAPIRAHAGELKLVDGASKGGLEELRASADAIGKIAKKISQLQLGDKQVTTMQCVTCNTCNCLRCRRRATLPFRSCFSWASSTPSLQQARARGSPLTASFPPRCTPLPPSLSRRPLQILRSAGRPNKRANGGGGAQAGRRPPPHRLVLRVRAPTPSINTACACQTTLRLQLQSQAAA